MARGTDTSRTRECRELFQRAIRDNVTVVEARRRIASERWSAIDLRLEARREETAHDRNDGRAPGFWWQRD